MELQGWRIVVPQWTVAGLARASLYRCEDVADNHGRSLNLGLGRHLEVAGFDYSIGPVLDYSRFDKNLNHFMRGHGGYYSPRRDLGLALNFQGAEARE